MGLYLRQSMRWTTTLACLALSSCAARDDGDAADAARRPAPPRSTVTALGKIEPGEGLIQISGPPAERIQKINVQVGQQIRAGEQLVETAGEAVLEKQLEVAQGKLAQANEILAAEKAHGESLLAEVELGLRRAKELPSLQIETQDGEVKVIENQLQQAERDLDRMRKSNFSEAEQDRQTQLTDRYREQLRAARSRLRTLEKERELSELEAKQKLQSTKAALTKAQEAIDIATAQRNVALVETELQRATIVSPVDGQVLDIPVQVGEVIGQRPIMTIGATHQMFVHAEVYESDIARVEIGQKAQIRSLALPAEISGTVDRIGQLVKRSEVVGLDPTARADARVFDVRIRLDDPNVAKERIGLQVDVTIETPAAEKPAK